LQFLSGSHFSDLTAKKTKTGEQRKRWQCNWCGKILPYKHVHDIHIRIHTGEKPYKCRFCSKAFGQASSMKRHIRIHTGDKPYVCKQCGKAFSDQSAFSRHSFRERYKTILKEEETEDNESN
jgi:KRAB domain-containing zinc finger protein